jgi:hypothetical protein
MKGQGAGDVGRGSLEPVPLAPCPSPPEWFS